MERHFYFVPRLTKKICFKRDEEEWIQVLLDSPLGHSELWSGATNDVGVRRTDRDSILQTIKEQLMTIQEGYCYYCGFSFKWRNGDKGTRSIERDHIAPKHIYRDFTFTPDNLVLACSACNSSDYKGIQDTVERSHSDYDKCQFNIVHPYLDNRENHLNLDATGLIKVVESSSKGMNTIEMFGLNETVKIGQRRMLSTFEQLPLDDDVDELISKSASENHFADD